MPPPVPNRTEVYGFDYVYTLQRGELVRISVETLKNSNNLGRFFFPNNAFKKTPRGETHIDALTLNQLEGLINCISGYDEVQLAAFTSVQVKQMSKNLLSKLSQTQIKKLPTTTIQALTTDQIQSFGMGSIQALTTDQIQSLTTDQIQALTSNQVPLLSRDQIQALTTNQIQLLTTNQLSSLKSKLTSAQLTYFTPAQKAASKGILT